LSLSVGIIILFLSGLSFLSIFSFVPRFLSACRPLYNRDPNSQQHHPPQQNHQSFTRRYSHQGPMQSSNNHPVQAIMPQRRPSHHECPILSIKNCNTSDISSLGSLILSSHPLICFFCHPFWSVRFFLQISASVYLRLCVESAFFVCQYNQGTTVLTTPH